MPLQVGKVNCYAALSPVLGPNVSKVNCYAVLGQASGLYVSKVNAYAVLVAPPSSRAYLFWDWFS